MLALQSERYPASDSMSPDGHSIPVQFSTLDEKHQTRMWRPIAKYYALTNILNFEPHVDEVIRTLQRQLEKRFCFGQNKGAVCNLHTWLSFGTYLAYFPTPSSANISLSRMGGHQHGQLQ